MFSSGPGLSDPLLQVATSVGQVALRAAGLQEPGREIRADLGRDPEGPDAPGTSPRRHAEPVPAEEAVEVATRN